MQFELMRGAECRMLIGCYCDCSVCQGGRELGERLQGDSHCTRWVWQAGQFDDGGGWYTDADALHSLAHSQHGRQAGETAEYRWAGYGHAGPRKDPNNGQSEQRQQQQ